MDTTASPQVSPTAPGRSEHQQLIALASGVAGAVRSRMADIRSVTERTRILALNALIEAARAGSAGRSFAVVAQEVKEVSRQIEQVATRLEGEVNQAVAEIDRSGTRLVDDFGGRRLADLALHAIEIIDRNLYERSCDVRWWATDAAVVAAAAAGRDAALAALASARLAVILRAYTVYLDIWICGRDGTVLANGQPQRWRVAGADVSREPWFAKALATRNGDEYAVGTVGRDERMGEQALTYATAIRAGGAADGEPIGVLAVHFDWGPQAQRVVDGIRLDGAESERISVMLLDADCRVLAGRGDAAVPGQRFALATEGRGSGHYLTPSGCLVGFALTPGYETYRGLGWYGCLVRCACAT